MKHKYIECMCGSDEHTLRFVIDEEDKTIYTSIFLNQYRPWWDKLKVAIKYLFGYKCKYGHWDEVLLDEEKIKELRDLCREVLDE